MALLKHLLSWWSSASRLLTPSAQRVKLWRLPSSMIEHAPCSKVALFTGRDLCRRSRSLSSRIIYTAWRVWFVSWRHLLPQQQNLSTQYNQCSPNSQRSALGFHGGLSPLTAHSFGQRWWRCLWMLKECCLTPQMAVNPCTGCYIVHVELNTIYGKAYVAYTCSSVSRNSSMRPS